MATSAKIIKEKYDIKPCGSGAAMPGGPIKQLTLCFDTKLPNTKEQVRELLVRTANELLQQINANNEIQEYLNEKPFTIKNVEIIIYNHDKTGRSLYYPNVSVARISRGNLIYRIGDANDVFKYVSVDEESYEEALKTLSLSIENEKNK